MAKTKFSINKATLIEEQKDGYILTRVPNSKMEYYWLLNEKDIISSDETTLIVECDAEQDITVLPRVVNGDINRAPSLQEAVTSMHNPIGTVSVKAQELYDDYYKYLQNLDPEERAERQRIRDQKREEALSRSDTSKQMKQQASQQHTQIRNNAEDVSHQQATLQTPAQRMEQQREQIQHYSKQQFKEILKGTRQKLDTTLYSNIRLNHQQMKELRLSIKVGLDVSKYNSPFISAKHMREIRIGAKRGVKFDMDKLDHSLYNADQIHELRLGFEKKLDVKKYLNPAYEAGQMKELRLAMQAGLDTRRLEDIHLTIEQMQTIRHQMVMNHLGDILKRFFENVRNWITESIQKGMEEASANLQNREARTIEGMKEDNMREAINDIKYTLVQSELLPEKAMDDIMLDDKIRNNIEELMVYMESTEHEVDKAVEVKVEDICQAVGAEVEIPKESKVVNMNQKQSDTLEQAIAEEVDRQLKEVYEMDEEIIIEEETFEMMQ